MYDASAKPEANRARDTADFDFLLDVARAGKRLRLSHFLHLDQPIGIWNYIRIANEIADTVPTGHLLDWGCGMGQMTYLLRGRGFDVVPYDIAATVETLPDLPLTRGLEIIRGSHPTNLPFADSSFDAVLSCGVLEHVDEYTGTGNEQRSLAEIHRVLRPNGRFVIYQLPQERTWQEAITRTLGLGYAHPRRFTARQIRSILHESGFEVLSLRRNNMLPKNLTAIPEALREFYSRFARTLIRIDASLSAVPVLNRIAGVLEVVALKAR
jgi:SAM-dependent methyltransferase